MGTRRLGSTGLEVSDLCLGAMMFGAIGNRDHAECERMIHTALDAGINFIDTADVYSRGESEEIVGGALKGRRDDVVLATKFWNDMSDKPNMRGGSRHWIMRAVEDSLRRLGTDHIDLYQMHRPDQHTDIDETLGALSDLVHQGKVRYIGSSTFSAEGIVEAQWAAERRNHERFMCEQPPYSIFVRGIERAVLPTCAKHGMGVIVWSPLNGGWLTGKYRRGEEVPKGSRGAARNFVDPTNDSKLDAIEQLAKVADDAGISLTHLSLAWSIEHPAVTSAIIGPKTPEQLDDLLGATDLVLSPDVLDAVDAIVPFGIDLDPTNTVSFQPGQSRKVRRRPR
jgi:aryl-alcohol dehydrogenase-like predicted oxidoreductase